LLGDPVREEFVEKLFKVVILSEAKDLLATQITDLQILRRFGSSE
jgi:hypothetical protein